MLNLDYSWKINDDVFSEETVPLILENGEYKVNFTVKDPDGQYISEKIQINVLLVPIEITIPNYV